MLAILLLALTFFQCKSDDDPGNCVCIEIFDPVCGDDGVLYSNSCYADCAGVTYTAGYCPEEATGLILDLGDPAVDGCGWVVQMTLDDTPLNYRPDTLAEAFKVDSLSVTVNFKQTVGTSPCGMIEQIPVIEVLEMTE